MVSTQQNSTWRSDPGSGYLKEVDPDQQENEIAQGVAEGRRVVPPDFRGHCYIPEDHALLGELQQALSGLLGPEMGIKAGMEAFKLVRGRKMSIFGWMKDGRERGRASGVALTVRPWKEAL